jgi:hypothetical protein
MIARIALALGLAFAYGSAWAAPPSSPDEQHREALKRHLKVLEAPMVFFVAKGAEHACGPGCSEWIAAEGTIDAGAASRLRAVLNRAGTPKLPVYFHTPGGSIEGAIELGRLMRERKLTAGIAWTLPQGCDAQHLDDKKCVALKRSGQKLDAEWRTDRIQCNSACVYALAGAAVRDVPVGARIGIHQAAVRLINRSNGQAVAINTSALRQRAQDHLQTENGRLKRYLREMGIEAGLLDAAAKVSHSTVRYLTRAEIVQFGIDIRRFVETPWRLDQTLRDRPGLVKLWLKLEPSQTSSANRMLGLFCVSESEVAVLYTRELEANSAPALVPIKIMGAGTSFKLVPERSPIATNDPQTQLDIRQARMPIGFFEAAAKSGHLDAAEIPAGAVDDDKLPRIATLSTVGLASGLPAFLQKCRPQPAARSAATVLTPVQRP